MSDVSGKVSTDWHDVCAEADLAPNEPLGVEAAGTPIGLYRLEDGVHAISDVCTHEFALLSSGFAEGGRIECPLHQACFDIRTGECFGPMAERGLRTFAVRIVAGRVQVAV